MNDRHSVDFAKQDDIRFNRVPPVYAYPILCDLRVLGAMISFCWLPKQTTAHASELYLGLVYHQVTREYTNQDTTPLLD
jgi:hypothetical protein